MIKVVWLEDVGNEFEGSELGVDAGEMVGNVELVVLGALVGFFKGLALRLLSK